jgi:tetratricopeptide (TPR) repeat protein
MRLYSKLLLKLTELLLRNQKLRTSPWSTPVTPSESLWAEKAIQQFRTVADEAADIGAAALHGRALFGLGDVLASLGRQEEAKQAIARSIELLETIHADGHLMKARKLLETI